jgi:hypothetical protein
MKYIQHFNINESDQDLISDLFDLGFDQTKYNFVGHSESWDKLEEVSAQAIENWKGPQGQRVKEVNGEVVERGDINWVDVSVVMTTWEIIFASDNHHLVEFGWEIAVFYEKFKGSEEKKIGGLTLGSYVDDSLPQLLVDHPYESSLGLGVPLQMLQLFKIWKTSK